MPMEEYVTQTQIKDATGISQPTLSRKLSKMQHLIKKTYGNVTVYHVMTLPVEWRSKLMPETITK